MVLNPLDPIGRRCLRIIASATKKIVGEGVLHDRLRRAAGTGSTSDFQEAAMSFNRLSGKDRRSIGDEAEVRVEMRTKDGAIQPEETVVGRKKSASKPIIEPPKMSAEETGRKLMSLADGWFARG